MTGPVVRMGSLLVMIGVSATGCGGGKAASPAPTAPAEWCQLAKTAAEDAQLSNQKHAEAEDPTAEASRIFNLQASIASLKDALSQFQQMTTSAPPEIGAQLATAQGIKKDTIVVSDRAKRAGAITAVQSYLASRCDVAFDLEPFLG